jgi:hypothetical protein
VPSFSCHKNTSRYGTFFDTNIMDFDFLFVINYVCNQCWDSGSAGSACFLGLPDPVPLIRDTDPGQDPSLFYKGVERTEIMLAK